MLPHHFVGLASTSLVRFPWAHAHSSWQGRSTVSSVEATYSLLLRCSPIKRNYGTRVPRPPRGFQRGAALRSPRWAIARGQRQRSQCFLTLDFHIIPPLTQAWCLTTRASPHTLTQVGISSPRWRWLPEPNKLSAGSLLSTVPQQGGITRRKLQFNLPGAGILKRDFLGMEMYPLGLVWSRFQRMSLATRRQVQGIRLLTMAQRIIKDCFPFQLKKQMILRLKGTQFLS